MTRSLTLTMSFVIYRMPSIQLFNSRPYRSLFSYTLGPFGRNPRISKKIAEVARKMSNVSTEFSPLRLNCCVISIKVLIQAEYIQNSPDMFVFFTLLLSFAMISPK